MGVGTGVGREPGWTGVPGDVAGKIQTFSVLHVHVYHSKLWYTVGLLVVHTLNVNIFNEQWQFIHVYGLNENRKSVMVCFVV